MRFTSQIRLFKLFTLLTSRILPYAFPLTEISYSIITTKSMKLFPILCTIAAASAIPAQAIVIADFNPTGPAAAGVATAADSITPATNTGAQGSFSFSAAQEASPGSGTVSTFLTVAGTGATPDPNGPAFDPMVGDTLNRGNLFLLQGQEGANLIADTTGAAFDAQGPVFNFLQVRTNFVHPGAMNAGPFITYTFDASDIALGAAAFQVDYAINNTNVNGNGVNFIGFVNDVAVDVGAISDGAAVTESFTFDATGLVAGDTVTLFLNDNGSNGADGTQLNSLTISAIPEPSSTLLLGFAGMAFAIRRRR